MPGGFWSHLEAENSFVARLRHSKTFKNLRKPSKTFRKRCFRPLQRLFITMKSGQGDVRIILGLQKASLIDSVTPEPIKTFKNLWKTLVSPLLKPLRWMKRWYRDAKIFRKTWTSTKRGGVSRWTFVFFDRIFSLFPKKFTLFHWFGWFLDKKVHTFSWNDSFRTWLVTFHDDQV